MKFQAGNTKSDFEIAPAGNHLAICYQVIDLGLQPGSKIFPDPKHQVRLTFELPTEQIEYTRDGVSVAGPMSIGQNFTASMHEKANLRKFVEGLYGKKFPTDDDASGFDLANLLGRACLLNVVHREGSNGRTYANIASAAPLPVGMQASEQVNESALYELENPDPNAFDKLPKWLQEKIENRLDKEPEDMPPSTIDEPYDDPVPF